MLSPPRWSPRRPLARCVHTPRRGQNLTERYRKLEDITRNKFGLSQSSKSAAEPVRARRTSKLPDTIVGFVIPKAPREPASDECCMSGCAVCVYDLYEEALAAYKDSVTVLRAALSARHIPETEWPKHIRTSKATSTTPGLAAAEKSKGAVLDAFEEMERVLKEKRERRAAVEAESSS